MNYNPLLFALLGCLLTINAIGQVIDMSSPEIKKQFARFTPKTDLDRAMLECIYEYTVVDPKLNESKVYYDMLQIGKTTAKYQAYARYRIDSVVYRMDITKITREQATEIYNRYESYLASRSKIIKNIRSRTLSFYESIFGSRYLYPDTVAINWQLVDSAKTICGHRCRKAFGAFRGRVWTVWYAPDIPIAEGPWKFGGLPGLILEMNDATGTQSFTAISVRPSTEQIILTEGNPFKTTRQRFNKQLKDFLTDPGKVMSGSQLAPKDANGKEIPIPKLKRFFNPIELE